MEAARPARCPCCKQAGRESAEKYGIHGHGLRSRVVLGQLDADGSRGVHEIVVRRYRCLSCGAILVVGPWDLLPRMLYSLVTVVVALACWALGSTKASVRAQLGAFAITGDSTKHDWRSLRRWASHAVEGQLFAEVSASLGGTLRERAARWVHILSGAGPPEESLSLRALAGAKHYR